MSDLLKRLHEQRMSAVKAAREIAERMSTADAENAEDVAAYNTANEDIEKFGNLARDERKRLDAENENAEAFAEAERRAGVKRENRGNTPDTPVDWQAQAREAIKSGTRSKGGTFETVPTRERLAELRALTDPFQKTSATHGQETVPTTLVDSLFVRFFADSAIMSAGPTILRTASGEQLKFPRLTSLGALSLSNARVAELGTINKGNATFDQVTMDAYKYGQISQSSREVIEDSVIDVRGLMGSNIGRNMANYFGYDLTLGDGSGKPRGVITVANASGQTVTGATGKVGQPSNIDDLLSVIAKLPIPYRRNAKWLWNDATGFVLRKFKINTTTGDNAYAWQPATIPGGPDTFLTYPIVTDPNVAATALGATSIVFGDFSMYYVRLVNDVRVEWSTEYAWDTDLVSVKAVLRGDGDAIDDTAFAAFIGGAS